VNPKIKRIILGNIGDYEWSLKASKGLFCNTGLPSSLFGGVIGGVQAKTAENGGERSGDPCNDGKNRRNSYPTIIPACLSVFSFVPGFLILMKSMDSRRYVVTMLHFVGHFGSSLRGRHLVRLVSYVPANRIASAPIASHAAKRNPAVNFPRMTLLRKFTGLLCSPSAANRSDSVF
jgi:hypothetical protein